MKKDKELMRLEALAQSAVPIERYCRVETWHHNPTIDSKLDEHKWEILAQKLKEIMEEKTLKSSKLKNKEDHY